MRIARLATFSSSAAVALGFLGWLAPAAASVPAFVAPWAIAIGLAGPEIGPTADAFSLASPPQDQVCQTLPPSPLDTHDVTVRHYE